MKNEENKGVYLSEEELEKAAGGAGELVIGHCGACGAWFDASNSKICPKCGAKI